MSPTKCAPENCPIQADIREFRIEIRELCKKVDKVSEILITGNGRDSVLVRLGKVEQLMLLHKETVKRHKTLRNMAILAIVSALGSALASFLF